MSVCVQLISTLSPLLLGLLALGVLVLYQRCLREDDVKRERKARQAVAVFATFMILVLYLTLPAIATSVFQTFNCRKFDDGTWLMRADYRWVAGGKKGGKRLGGKKAGKKRVEHCFTL
jgi:hypothetical protein